MRFWWSRAPQRPMQLGTPVSVDFAGVLEAELATSTTPVVPLAAALDATRAELGEVQRIGPVDAGHDLYGVIDRLADAVRASYPASLCRSGCGRCCEYPTAFFDFYEAEWQLIVEHVAAHWSPERHEAFLARFHRTHGPYRLRLALFGWLMGQSLPIFPTRQALPLSCPFLEDERCSIYAARPFPCRTFGSFTTKLTAWSQPHVYGCAEQGEVMDAAVLAAPLPVYMPDVAPLQWKELALAHGPKRTMAAWIRRSWGRRRPDKTPG